MHQYRMAEFNGENNLSENAEIAENIENGVAWRAAWRK